MPNVSAFWPDYLYQERIISRTVAIFGAWISLLFLRDCVRQREYDKLMGGICRTRSEHMRRLTNPVLSFFKTVMV